MLNDILLSFFFGMPAIVIAIEAHKLRHPIARFVLQWGGIVAVALVALVSLSMISCDGTIMSSYSNCVGGTSVAKLFNGLQGGMKTGTFFYIMIGIPLACLAYGLEWLHNRRTT